MNELLEKDQSISIIPQNFKNSNKGKIVELQDRKFLLEVEHSPEGILINNLIEFYSQTKNGMLYFTSDVTEINGNILTVKNPIKHRFLQRRAFTRVKLLKDMICNLAGTSYPLKSLDISSGGMKFETEEKLDLNSEYEITLPLIKDQTINCKLELIRIEKNDKGSYTLSGRFKNLSDTDRMTLIQYCMRRNIENMNKSYEQE